MKDSPATPPLVSGILVVDKPMGWSSMRAVAAVRRRAGGVKTGHAGTLDPLATGVLVMALGRATKLIERLMDTPKRYRTRIDLSAFTATDDLEGERSEIPVDEPPTRARIDAALTGLTGRIMQRPPAFSAMKVGGRRAYKLARRGAEVKLPLREVCVDAIAIVEYAWPFVEIDVRCGKGTYIRSIARDLGVALGTGGHCVALRRTEVGPFTIGMAWDIEELPDQFGAEMLLTAGEAVALVASCRAQRREPRDQAESPAATDSG